MGIRYSIDLDKKLHVQYKMLAIEKDKRMRTLVIEALESYLAKERVTNVICKKPGCVITVEHTHTGIGPRQGFVRQE